jgi:aspartate/methionine/tyrosine aminotransferase
MPIEIESPEELGYSTIRCNLAESSVTDASWSDLNIDLHDLVFAYSDHRGLLKLRERIAADYEGIHAGDVLVTPGAVAALFIVNTSLLEREDHLVVEFPNYASNLETPFAIGCEMTNIELKFENNFRVNTEAFTRALTPETKLVSVTNPHNPTGVMLDEEDLLKLIRIAEERQLFLLVDETYRDLAFNNKPPLAASLSDRVISVSSVSKAHGLPGLRIGWIVTRNTRLQQLFLAAKEQIVICNSVLDEEVAFRYLVSSEKRQAFIRAHVERNYEIVSRWMESNPFLEWVKPAGGCVCFPRFKKDVRVDIDLFYKLLAEKYRTLVGSGHWFGMDRAYFRVGFGWPSAEELEAGLQAISASAKEAVHY